MIRTIGYCNALHLKRKRTINIFNSEHKFILAIFLLVCLVGPTPTLADTPDRKELRDRLKLLWDSLATIEIHCEEYVPDSKGEPDLGRAHTVNHFCHKKDNYWYCDIQSVLPSGIRKPIDQIRQDGEKRQQIRMFEEYPDQIQSVDIKSQVSSPFEYVEAKFSALWVLLPGGRFPHVYLDRGAKIGPAKTFGPACVMVEAIHQNKPLRMVLDGDHDWLPRHIETGEGEDVLTHDVIQFKRDNGRWFPSEGQSIRTTERGPLRRLFVVKKVGLNREVNDGLFRLPLLPTGVRISNDIIKKISFQGGEQAYQTRRSKYSSKGEKSAQEGTLLGKKQLIVAERTPGDWPWTSIIIGSSAGLIAIAAGLWWRRN